MRPLIEANPKLAPWLAALIVVALSLLFAVFERRALVFALLEAATLGVAFFVLVRSMRPRSRDDGDSSGT